MQLKLSHTNAKSSIPISFTISGDVATNNLCDENAEYAIRHELAVLHSINKINVFMFLYV